MKSLTKQDIGSLAKCLVSDPQFHSWHREELERSYSRGLLKAVFIEEGPGIISVIGYQELAEEVEILFLMTNPQYRQKGLMKELFKHFLQEIASKPVFLEVSAKNLEAIGLYRKLGFEQTGKRPFYYADGSDAILMALKKS